MDTSFNVTLRQGAEKINIDLTDKILKQFEWYATFLIEQNKKINLTAIIDPAEMAEKHFLDSLMIADEINNLIALKMIDIGSGAGFPGLPLKIYRPNIDLVLLEAVGKKVNFINQVIQSLKLTKAQAIWSRAEDFAHQQRESFDVAVSRAVADMSVLAEYALPLVKVGGFFVAYKGINYKEELDQAHYAISTLGGQLADIKTLQLPLSHEPRVLIKIAKTTATPAQYPRRAGLPNKKPLLK